MRAASCTPAAMRPRRSMAVLAALACADAGARDAWQASLQAHPKDRPPPRSPVWDKSLRCVRTGYNATKRAYAVVLGPISEERKYAKWVYPILALKAALHKKGSRADVLALLALEEGKEHQRMLPTEEGMLRRAKVRWRYVPKPRIRGFHMGHYKLWVRDAAYVEAASTWVTRFTPSRRLDDSPVFLAAGLAAHGVCADPGLRRGRLTAGEHGRFI